MKLPHFSLRWQLMLSYLPLLLIPILVVGIVTRSATEQGLTVLVTQGAQRHANQIVDQFAAYYAEHGTWQGVKTLLLPAPLVPNPPPPNRQPNRQPAEAPPNNNPNNNLPLRGSGAGQPSPEQILIADPTGKVVASDSDSSIGQVLSTAALSHGAAIYVDNKLVGTLVIGAALGIFDQQQRQLLDTINGALWLSGVVSIVVTLALGLWLSRQITSPIKQLMQGVAGLTNGRWTKPLPVHYQNEFGDLTRAFNHMAEETTHQEQLRRQMVADIAHDLRTPLSVMRLEVEAIRAGMQTPVEASESLQEEIEWLQHMVDDLHTLSLMDAGQIDIQCEPVDPASFLRSIFVQWQPIAAKENRQIALELAGHLPAVSVDPHRMRQALGNLLNNALQHTPSEAQISLRGICEYDRQQIKIEVVDNGQGIAANDLPHIFERFYRADRSRWQNPHHRSSGMGLSITSQLVALQGGKIAVQSELGRGSTFSILLPILSQPIG
ncbi:MAG: HAMP domain-containing sensor histidine kinase [Chloroflexota bacterium]